MKQNRVVVGHDKQINTAECRTGLQVTEGMSDFGVFVAVCHENLQKQKANSQIQKILPKNG